MKKDYILIPLGFIIAVASSVVLFGLLAAV